MAKIMAHKLLIFCWLVVVLIGSTVSSGGGDVASSTGAPETTPTAAPETTPTAAPETTPTAAPETTPTAAPETTPTAAPETTPTAAPETTPTAAPETTPTAAPETTPTAAPETTPTAAPETTPTAAPETTPTAAPETTPTAAPDTTPTAAPDTTPTAAPDTTPTAAPDITPTAVPDPDTTLTAAPDTTLTAAPDTTLTAAPDTTLTAAPDTTPTAAPDTTPTAAPDTTTAGRPDPCLSNPCGFGSTCEARANETYICLCLPGSYYNGACQTAKVFPGVFTLSKETYDPKYADKTSMEFFEKAKKIVAVIAPKFATNKGYLTSNVLELSPAPAPADSRALWSTKSIGVAATVENIFDSMSDIKITEVTKLSEEIAEDLDATYEAKPLCPGTCDVKTTDCEETDGLYSCPCKKGFVKTDLSDRLCLACPSGQQAEGDSKCIDCDFGFSGLNCKEYWKLLLVIVGSSLGGLLLIVLIILVARKPSKKTSKKSADTGVKNDYESASELKKGAKEPFVNGVNGVKAPAGAVPRIPRASANNGWDRGTNLEMTPSNSRQNLVPTGGNMRTYEDADEMRAPYRAQTNPYAPSRAQTNPYAQNGGQTNPYAPNRAQTNPYDQSRAQLNPYAQSRGQTNPYYTHDDGRRLN